VILFLLYRILHESNSFHIINNNWTILQRDYCNRLFCVIAVNDVFNDNHLLRDALTEEARGPVTAAACRMDITRVVVCRREHGTNIL